MAEQIAVRIREQSGAALLVDYGEEGSSKHTFRVHSVSHLLLFKTKCLIIKGFRSHQVCDPLVDPGSCDLTADVDFAALKHLVSANGKFGNYFICC